MIDLALLLQWMRGVLIPCAVVGGSVTHRWSRFRSMGALEARGVSQRYRLAKHSVQADTNEEKDVRCQRRQSEEGGSAGMAPTPGSDRFCPRDVRIRPFSSRCGKACMHASSRGHAYLLHFLMGASRAWPDVVVDCAHDKEM